MSRALIASLLGIAAVVTAVLGSAGCAVPVDRVVAAPVDGALRPWRSVQGGFLAAAAPAIGGPLRPGAGAFVRLVFPSAIALRDNELLVVDSGAGRVYRCDIALNALIPIAGAPATPQTRVALGPDLSAYVLDAPARRVLRFARDGRLLQTFRADESLAGPVDFALTSTHAALLIADRTLAQVAIVGMAGGTVVPVRAARAEGRFAGGATAVAAGRDDMYLLDGAAGVVHRVSLDGAVLASFGEGQFAAPTALAVDRFERVYVADPAAGRLLRFDDGRLAQTWTAAQLDVQRLGGFALDGNQFAVSDLGTGRVNLFRVAGAP